MALDRTLFEIRVKESDQNREYWVNKPWLQDRRADVRCADILVLPWVDFREEGETLFPLGTADIVAMIAAATDLTVGVAVDRTGYKEILLHSKEHRFPTLLVNSLILPAVAGVLSNLATDAIKGVQGPATVELRVIVEGDHGRCISVDYKGPPDRLSTELLDEVNRCLPPPQTEKAHRQRKQPAHKRRKQ